MDIKYESILGILVQLSIKLRMKNKYEECTSHSMEELQMTEMKELIIQVKQAVNQHLNML